MRRERKWKVGFGGFGGFGTTLLRRATQPPLTLLDRSLSDPDKKRDCTEVTGVTKKGDLMTALRYIPIPASSGHSATLLNDLDSANKVGH